MALEATHIRFAVDLQKKYGIKDPARYISGSIYPDSRYVTKIDRMATHPEDYMSWDLKRIDDFKKGWHAHLMADQIQFDVTRELLPQVFVGSQGQGGERWIKHTALKILQDLDDVKKFDITYYLPFLDHPENPNGENIKTIKQYNAMFQKMYAKPEVMSIDGCYEMWRQFGIGDELAVKLKLQAEAYASDKVVMDAVPQIYPLMLAKANNPD